MYLKYLLIPVFFILSLNVYAQTKLTLEKSIDIGIQNNKQVEALRFETQKEEAAISRGFNLPKLKLFAEYEGVKGSLNNFEERKIGLSQDFEFPTVYFNRADVQSIQADISKARLENLINNLKSDIKERYVNLVYQNSLRQVINENLKSYQSFEFTAGRKYEEGAGTNLEVLGARVNRIKYENHLRNIESGVKTDQAELRALMGVDYNIEVTEELTFKELTITQAELIRTAITNNPELKIARLRKHQSDSRVSLAVSELLPDFSLSYYNQKIGGTGGYYGFEIGVGVPLFFWLEPSSKIEEANLEVKAVNSEELFLNKAIESQVIIAYESYQNSMRQLGFFTGEALKEAEEILRVSGGSYNEGAIDYTEYLQSLNIVNETRTQYLEALYNYNLSIITLERLTGLEL